MKLFLTFLIFFSFFNASQAQVKTISGVVSGYEANTKIYLKLFKGNAANAIDSAYLDKSGKFFFSNNKYPKYGLHQLKIESEQADFPIGKSEEKIEIISSKEQLKNGVIVLKNNTEVLAYQAFLKQLQQGNSTLDSITKITKQLNRIDKKYKTKMDALQNFQVSFSEKYNTALNNIAKLYANTYTANILVPLFLIPLKNSTIETDTMYDTQAAYTHYHNFDYVNFKDEGTIYNNYYNDKVFDFIKNYSISTPEGIKESMDIVLRKTLLNINIKEHTVAYLLELAAQKNDMDIAEYLFKNYYTEGCEANAKPEVGFMLQNLKRLAVGQPAPDLEMIDVNSKRVKLSDTKSGKYILVYFWSSTCGHCRESTPKLKALYEQYKSKGLEVYAVSLDTDYANWNSYVEQEKLNWINVSELKGWQSRAVELYSINGTPTYYLIGNDNRIAGRYSTFEQFEMALKELY